jgi:predicted GIY-YIG superfamily endonuclease
MPKAKRYVIYLLTNPNNGYFYIGKDCNYPKRVIQHQNALAH